MESRANKDGQRRFHWKSADENTKPLRFPLPSTFEAFTRPISALARHRVHQLSEIREVSAGSKANSNLEVDQGWIDGGKDRPETPAPQTDALSHTTSSEYLTPTGLRSVPNNLSKALGSRATSAISLPGRQVPERRSSASIFSRSLAGSGQNSMQELPSWRIPELEDTSKIIPDRGRAESPVRRALGRAAQSSEILRPSFTRTFIRTSPPHEVLDNGSVRNPRVSLSVHLPSPLFVGGGTAEGRISIEVDGGLPRKPKTKPIYISKASVDVIGVEEVSDGRRWIFLSLATELFDNSNPPPPSLVTSPHPEDGPELWWELKASTTVLPFCINLPLKLGPPPYSSKHASIRYLLCPSITIRTGDRRSVVRQTWSVQMLTIHDPERALASLPSPLLAADTLYLAHEPELQVVKLTAGLHRQTWVNGALIFIDLHISNNSPRTIKKIEVQLEKTTLWYTHAPVGTSERSAPHLRLPRRTDTEIVSGTVVKKSNSWRGVGPHSSDIRTIELDAPRGHVTISTGRYFEIRYFVNVVVSVKIFKTVAVQLPVTIIPINSLDILPNSLAQVAASIEAKRAKTVPAPPNNQSRASLSFQQGQAFMAPVRQSLEKIRQERGRPPTLDVDSLTKDIDKSPRRFAHTHNHSHCLGGLSRSGIDENCAPGRVSFASCSRDHLIRHPSCYHCHLLYEKDQTPKPEGPRLPRLQVSTSGLGFSESEFEVPADSPPRKVMLSEQERNMINQIKELKTRQQRAMKKTRKGSQDPAAGKDSRIAKEPLGWTNVVLEPDAGPKQMEHGNASPGGVKGRKNSTKIQGPALQPAPGNAPRSRSKTNPEALTKLPGPTRPRRRSSTDRHERGTMSMDGTSQPRFPHRTSKEVRYRTSVDHLL